MKNRRNLLKGAIGVGATASVMPSSWVKPVMCSIVLPAHAQQTPIAPAQVTLLGFVVTCTQPDLFETKGWQINDMNTALPIIEVGTNFFTNVNHSQSSSSQLDIFSNGIPGGMGVNNSSASECPRAFFSGLSPVSFQTIGIANGTVYNASGSINTTGDAITLSDIVFTPQ